MRRRWSGSRWRPEPPAWARRGLSACRSASRAVLSACLVLAASGAWCAQVQRQGTELVVRGLLATTDLHALPADGVRSMVFEHSPGGTVEAALAYAIFIRRHRLDTVVRGKCMSACAIAFLAGERRSAQTRAGVSVVFLHLGRGYTDAGVAEYEANDQLMEYIVHLTGDRLRGPVRDLVRRSWTGRSGVAFVILPGLFGPRYKAFYCDGTQGADISNCRRLPDADPFDLGILTGKP